MNKITKFAMAFFLIAGALAGALMKVSPAVSAAEATPQWDAVIEMSPDQTSNAQANGTKMSSSMQIKGVTSSLAGSQLKLSGSQGIEQFRSALFDEAAQWVDFRGGPVELNLVLPVGDAPITLNLEARTTAGYRWEVLSSASGRYAQNGAASFAVRYAALGAPSIQTIQLKSSGSGDGSVHLIYRRGFGEAAPIHARLNLRLASTNGVVDISDPTPTAPKADDTVSKSSDGSDPYAELKTTGLPTSLDWRTQGIVPAVRDQGSCGGCWAFGTVGVMESAVKKAGGPLTDLSEQFLISCNNSGWNCDGGLTASMYHYDTLALNQTAIGAVLESAKPYTATNGSCTVSLPHPYKANSWQFITPNEWSMPTVDQIKSAIYTYGPVTAGVCVGPAFEGYTPGTVFSTDETADCPGTTFHTNHQIVLVGWNDATQSWIMRNSWGPYWGNAGYMDIKWNTSRVGEGTSWIKYVGPVVIPTTVAPIGLISDTTPSFVFTRISGATTYKYQLFRGTTLIYTKTVAAGACGSTTNCVNTPTSVLPYAASYTWKVRAFVNGSWTAFSAARAFNLSDIPRPVTPTGTVTVNKPTFTFTKVNGATRYGYQLLKGATVVYTKNLVPSACGTATNCTVTSTTALANGAYTWKVRALVAGTWRSYSVAQAFTVNAVAFFYSPFTSTAAAWIPQNGWSLASGY